MYEKYFYLLLNSSFLGKMVFLRKLKLIYHNTCQHYNNCWAHTFQRGQRLYILYKRLQRKDNKVITILHDKFFYLQNCKVITFEENFKIVSKMIYLISQFTFIFLTKNYYNMNFITSSSASSKDFTGYIEINIFRLLLEDFL